jgi:hypothetical protein
MHSTKLNESATNPPLAVRPPPGWLGSDDPHAAIATAQLTAATAIGRPRRYVFTALVLLGLRNIAGSSGSWMLGLSGYMAGGITPR